MTNNDVDIIFLKPEKFEDCVKVAEHIKEEKIVSINLSQLDDKASRRVLDYVTGAVFITDAEIINVGNKIFCTIPNTKTYKIDSPSEYKSDEEEEIIPFKK